MKTQCIAVAAAVILMLGVAEGLICYSCNDVTAGSCRNIDSTSAYTTCTSGYTQCTTSYTVAVLNRGCAGPNVTTSCSFANVQCTYVCSTDKCNTQGINAAPSQRLCWSSCHGRPCRYDNPCRIPSVILDQQWLRNHKRRRNRKRRRYRRT